VKDGRIEQDNFHSYQVVRMNEMPPVETIVMPSGGFWGGVGEPTIAVAAPAVLNAIFAATGKRIRELPLKNHSLNLDPVITHEMHYTEFQKAMELMKATSVCFRPSMNSGHTQGNAFCPMLRKPHWPLQALRRTPGC